jgi:hypothetical protein
MASKLEILKSWKMELEPKVSELKKRVDELTEQEEAIPVKIKFLDIFGEDYKSLILVSWLLAIECGQTYVRVL